MDLALDNWLENCEVGDLRQSKKKLPAAKKQAAVAIALYRQHDPMQSKEHHVFNPAKGTGGNNYTIFAPPPDTELRVDDWIVALGSRRFGRSMNSLGLLRG